MPYSCHHESVHEWEGAENDIYGMLECGKFLNLCFIYNLAYLGNVEFICSEMDAGKLLVVLFLPSTYLIFLH